MSEQPAHSKIGASSYYRWKACPGSVKLSEGIESRSSVYAEEGTLAHDIASQMLEYHFFGKDKPNMPAGVTAEMLDAVKIYVNYVKKQALALDSSVDKNHVLIEHRFDLSSVHAGLFGTGDAVLYSKIHKRLVVIDYKHGAGIAVDVENNLQLQYYALGALISTGFPCDEVEVVIVQPRGHHADGPIRTWRIESLELMDFMAELEADAIATEADDAPIIAGSHCRFCPAASSKCPVLKEKANAAAVTEFKTLASGNEEEISRALDNLPAIEAYVKRVREYAYQMACEGNAPPGYKLVAKRASRKWIGLESDIAKELEKIMPRGEFYTSKLKSVPQVEKMLPKELKPRIVELFHKESSGMNLVPESAPGDPIKVAAAEEFKQLTEGEE